MSYDLNIGPKRCLKCQHVRQADDPGPETACPKCGAIYAKVEEAERNKRIAAIDAAERRKLDAEHRQWQQEHGQELSRSQAQERKERRLAHAVYLLYLLPLGFTPFVGLILAHVMHASASTAWIKSHFRWQIATFWWLVVWALLALGAGWLVLRAGLRMMKAEGTVAGVFALGSGFGVIQLVLAALALWAVYRCIKGWVYLFREDAV